MTINLYTSQRLLHTVIRHRHILFDLPIRINEFAKKYHCDDKINYEKYRVSEECVTWYRDIWNWFLHNMKIISQQLISSQSWRTQSFSIFYMQILSLMHEKFLAKFFQVKYCAQLNERKRFTEAEEDVTRSQIKPIFF